MEKIAIVGGTFDPIHWGHVQIADAALKQEAVDLAIWVPDPTPPQKAKRGGVEIEHRREMVRRAIAPYPQFILAPTLGDRQQTSYAIATFTALQKLYPHHQWYWTIGADAFQHLPKWYKSDQLAAACHWVVAPRAGTPSTETLVNSPHSASLDYQKGATPDLSTLGMVPNNPSQNFILAQTHMICDRVARQFAQRNLNLRYSILQSNPIAVSSTVIRRNWGTCSGIRNWVPEPVRTYISMHKLYDNPFQSCP
jgi:nicotinate-nucleotide adenylyltransferase